jgi:hypothetical protein
MKRVPIASETRYVASNRKDIKNVTTTALHNLATVLLFDAHVLAILLWLPHLLFLHELHLRSR